MPSKKRRRLTLSSRRKARADAQPEDSSTVSPKTPVPLPNAPQGLEILCEGDEPVVDIVAIHGLNGDRQKTWTAANNVHWLRDLLPGDLPRARIMSWGYDAKTHSSSRVSCQYLYDHALTLVSDLCRKRQLDKSTRRPIIFVAHSLGGIIVKSALIHSDASRQGALPEHRSIKLSTYGIVFMGTPHQGGNGVHLGKLLTNVTALFIAADDRLLKHLERDSEWLQQQLGQYGPISNDFVTKFAYEEYETQTLAGHKIMVVPRASAVVPGQANGEPIVIHSDHLNMVKFPSKEDNGYETISEHLQIMLADIDVKIQARWEEEERMNEARNDIMSSKWSLPLSLSDTMGVPHFVAREDELTQISSALRNSSDGQQTVILQGLGGMGKTQLAIEYVKRHHKQYSAVIWLNARDETTLKQSFAQTAERISQQDPSIAYIQNAVQSKDLDQATQTVRRWLGESRNTQWLVIYDNYDEPKFSSPTDGMENDEDDKEERDEASEAEGHTSNGKGFDIRPFFPTSYQGAIIITTRSSEVKFGEVVRLGKLGNICNSLEILASTSHRKGLEDDETAMELARRLDGLPLALSTAGSYLDQVGTSYAEYLELYETSWLRLQKATPQLPAYNYAMYSTWNISYRHIKEKDEKAAKLLKLWAYFDNEDLWFELLQSGRSDSDDWMLALTQDRLCFHKTMRVLCSHGLVEADPPARKRGPHSSGYSVHGCVHSWMGHVLNKETDEDMSRLAMECVARYIPDEAEEEYWLTYRRLLRHADQCLVRIKKDGSAQGNEQIWVGLGYLYYEQGRFSDAEAVCELLLSAKEKAYGPEHPSTLDIANGLGLIYDSEGRFSDAEEMFKRTLQGKETKWGPEHITTLNTVSNLGILYSEQGRLNDAETMHKRALQSQEKIFGPEHISTLDMVGNLGLLYSEQGRLNDAEEMLKRALQGKEKIRGPEHISTLKTVSNLGVLYTKQGRFNDAEMIFERLIRQYEKILGPENLETLNVITGLGFLFSENGRIFDAEALYRRVLRGYEEALGDMEIKTYPPALDTMKNLGIILDRLGRASEAQECYTRAEAGIRITYGRDSERHRDIVARLRSV